jgi:hypothetical protein
MEREKMNKVIYPNDGNTIMKQDEIFCIRDGQKLTYDEVFGE